MLVNHLLGLHVVAIVLIAIARWRILVEVVLVLLEVLLSLVIDQTLIPCNANAWLRSVCRSCDRVLSHGVSIGSSTDRGHLAIILRGYMFVGFRTYVRIQGLMIHCPEHLLCRLLAN